MNEQVWWYVARSSGFIAWTLLTVTLVWGVLLATRVLKPHDKPAWLLDLHRWLGALTVGFLAVHLVALVADSYVTFSLTDLLIPFASPYQRFAVGLGVLSLYLLVMVQISSVYMRRIPTRWWRAIHLWGYVLVLLTSWHAVLAGTDVGRVPYAFAAVALSVAPAIALIVRLVKRPARRSRSSPRTGPAGGSRRMAAVAAGPADSTTSHSGDDDAR